MRFECSFASIARSNRLVSKITCNSAQAPGRGYFQKLVPIIAAVATAITMVAIQPTMRSVLDQLGRPITVLGTFRPSALCGLQVNRYSRSSSGRQTKCN